MSPEDVDQFVKFNEPKESPQRRLQLSFSDDNYAIILLNDEGIRFSEFSTSLEGKCPTLSVSSAFGCDILTIDITKPRREHPNYENKNTKFNGWEVFYDGNSLLIPTKSSKETRLPPSIGIVITGKDALLGKSPIRKSRFLNHNEPTPFVKDQYEDSWNSNYFLEPRLIESVPSTIFCAIESILQSGKLAFASKDFESATVKYEKAYHYCHSFFPESLPDDELQTATDLKMRSLLNLSLAALLCETKLRFHTCSEACSLVLQMPECVDTNKAKALYRKGKAILMLGDDTQAWGCLQESLRITHDPKTIEALRQCDAAAVRRRAILRRKMTAAFK